MRLCRFTLADDLGSEALVAPGAFASCCEGIDVSSGKRCLRTLD
jgi:hypothetical protein